MRKHYPTDLKDKEWEIIEPLIPPVKVVGRPRTTDMREVLNLGTHLNLLKTK